MSGEEGIVIVQLFARSFSWEKFHYPNTCQTACVTWFVQHAILASIRQESRHVTNTCARTCDLLKRLPTSSDPAAVHSRCSISRNMVSGKSLSLSTFCFAAPGNNFLISCPSHHDSWALVRYSCRASSWSAALLVYCSWTWTWTFRYQEICFALLIVATHFCNSQWKIKLFNQWCTSHCDLIGSRGSTHAQKIFEVYLFVGHFLLKFMHNLRI